MIYSYRRVSTDEQHNGPQAQFDAIYNWRSSRENFPPIKDFFDNGVSGSVPLDKRPEGGKLCNLLGNGDTIVAAKLDRLFRSVSDASITIAEWNERKIKLVTIYEGFDMCSPMGVAMAHMACVFAELERAMIRERTRAALASKKARGECVGEVPYGWVKVDAKLVESTCEQYIITRINHLYKVGKSEKEIALNLNNSGYRAKKGGKWHATQVRRILDREK